MPHEARKYLWDIQDAATFAIPETGQNLRARLIVGREVAKGAAIDLSRILGKPSGYSNVIPEIEQHRDEIIAICKEYGLERLEVFGSAATEKFDPDRSDVDFLVVYPDGFDYGPWGARVDELRAQFEQLLGRKVDLVVLRWVDNPYVRRSIERQRVQLYAR